MNLTCDQVVNETEGAEEYVHLKSLEDEFHYMESTMPKKEGGEGGGSPGRPHHYGEGEEEHPLEDGDCQGGGEEGREGASGRDPRYYYDYHDEDGQAADTHSPNGRGDLPDDTPLEEYGFDLDQFAAASKERTSTVHQPQYCMDPEYEDGNESERGVGGSPRSPPQRKRGSADREHLFGDKVELDDQYGLSSTTPSASGGGVGSSVVRESKGELREVEGLRASASYESLHDID